MKFIKTAWKVIKAFLVVVGIIVLIWAWRGWMLSLGNPTTYPTIWDGMSSALSQYGIDLTTPTILLWNIVNKTLPKLVEGLIYLIILLFRVLTEIVTTIVFFFFPALQ
jgi:hypothetical protein